MKKKKIDIVFLLDNSGSMYGFEEDTIGGYNSFIKNQKEENIDANVTVVLFNNKYNELIYKKDIKEIKKLTRKDYITGGCTALLDAIGHTITKLDKETNNKVLFVITTDGLENASKEYNKDQIKKMIKNHNTWEFIYLGANIDSFSEGANLGISKDNIANFKKDKKGIDNLYKSISKASTMLYECDNIASSWKKELEK